MIKPEFEIMYFGEDVIITSGASCQTVCSGECGSFNCQAQCGGFCKPECTSVYDV